MYHSDHPVVPFKKCKIWWGHKIPRHIENCRGVVASLSLVRDMGTERKYRVIASLYLSLSFALAAAAGERGAWRSLKSNLKCTPTQSTCQNTGRMCLRWSSGVIGPRFINW